MYEISQTFTATVSARGQRVVKTVEDWLSMMCSRGEKWKVLKISERDKLKKKKSR